jgi:signal transduction histidine kinase
VSAEEQRRRRLRHDLRTPLTIVSGFAEVLAADRAISDADRREYASRIQAAAVEIGEIVDAILEDRPRDGGPPPAA